ncbi:MAG: Rieske 2Fe-2S domain-containing protein [Deinococcales bacterium]
MMERRSFLASLGRAVSLSLVFGSSAPQLLNRALAQDTEELEAFSAFEALPLLNAEGEVLRLSGLEPHTPYIFHYPYVSTPNFLINLDQSLEAVEIPLADGKSYLWPGGIGKDKSIVALSAICPHAYSFVSEKSGILNYAAPNDLHGPLISCCAHVSRFDAAQGGKVSAGPSPFALAAVHLVYDEAEDSALAVGILGQNYLDNFLQAQRDVLKENFGSLGKAKVANDMLNVVSYESYTALPLSCPIS